MALKTSIRSTVIIISIVSMMAVIILAVALASNKKTVSVERKQVTGCLDSMSIIVVATSNEHQSCEDPRQKIEVYPNGDNKVLVKCVCSRNDPLP